MSNDYDTLANKFADLLSFRNCPRKVRRAVNSNLNRELESAVAGEGK